MHPAVSFTRSNAAESGGEQESQTEKLAKETQNPIANLISVPFQNNFNFGIGPNGATQWILNIQPVIPITLNKDWNLIKAPRAVLHPAQSAPKSSACCSTV